jgi:hypothetical protein
MPFELGTAAMPTIRISDESMLDLLLADLTARPDAIGAVVAPDKIELAIMGSYNSDAMRLATLLRIRAWESAQRSRGIDVYVDIE